MQHVFQKSGYHYPKTAEAAVYTKMIAGNSILWAPSTHYSLRYNDMRGADMPIAFSLAGHSHSRHRKVMNPAFSAQQLRSFLPLFRRSASKVRLTDLGILGYIEYGLPPA